MTKATTRPHSCYAFRKAHTNDSLRLAVSNDHPQSFTRTVETPIFLPEETSLNLEDKIALMEGPLTPRTDRNAEFTTFGLPNNVTAIRGKCDGVKSHGFGLKDAEYFYLTTNKRDYNSHKGLPAPLARPRSSKFYPSESKFLKSLYEDEYGGKKAATNLPIRSGTASGNRKNNPHPLESFMIWKFPGRLTPMEQLHDLNDDIMNTISKESLKSTYQVDYIGMRQGAQMQHQLNNTYPTMKSDVPKYTLDSTSRFEYQKPKLHGNLKNNTSRYGCNARKCIPAIGAVPNVSSKFPVMPMHGSTLYSQEYLDKSENAKISEHVRPTVAKKLNRYLENRNRDSENTARILQKLANFEESQAGPNHLSDWAGPR